MNCLNNIEQVASRSIFNQISNTGGALMQPTWTTNIPSLGFQPDFCIVRSVIYQTLSTGDTKIYQIRSSLSNDPIAVFPGSNSIVGDTINPIISNPNQLIRLNSNPIQSISFDIHAFATDGTNLRAAPGFVVAKSSSIMLQIDFIKLVR